MKRFKYEMVSIMAKNCLVAAILSCGVSQAQEVRYSQDYKGLYRNSQSESRFGWVPNTQRFEQEQTEDSSPARHQQTETQRRLWWAYRGRIGTETNVYANLAKKASTGPTGQNQKASGPLALPYVEKNGHLNVNFVVMFSATWCSPCRRMYPVMEQLRKEGYIVYVFALDKKEYRDLGSKFQIRAYPTFLFFDKGKEVLRSVGGAKIEWFRKNLKQNNNPYDGI